MRRRVFSFALTVISRTLLCRDRISGRMRKMQSEFAFDAERLLISSGGRDLCAVSVSAGENAPVILICHGIGERVEYWSGVQRFLQTAGIASFVFNYSGYGASSGSVSAEHCEQDTLAAYQALVDRGNRSIFFLGFSLGSGVVSAVAPGLKIDGVVLCEGFTTIREAACAIGLPRWMACMVTDVWGTVHRVKELQIPVLVVHSDEDRLFPLSMATKVAEACGHRGELMVINGLSHNAPIFSPSEAYWGPIVTWVRQHSSQSTGGEPLETFVSPR